MMMMMMSNYLQLLFKIVTNSRHVNVISLNSACYYLTSLSNAHNSDGSLLILAYKAFQLY